MLTIKTQPAHVIPKRFTFSKQIFLQYVSKYKAETDRIVSADSRGFIFGGTLAYRLNPMVLARKSASYSGACYGQEYKLEYGTAKIELQCDSIHDGEKIVIIDDLCATGGTVLSVIQHYTKTLEGRYTSSWLFL